MAPTGLRVKEKVNINREVRLLDNAEEGSASDDEIPGKDETEERLEKLLFGDDAGFLEGLRARPANSQLTVRADPDDREAESAGDEDVEAIADENVRTRRLPRKVIGNANAPFLVALFPRFWCGHSTERLAYTA